MKKLTLADINQEPEFDYDKMYRECFVDINKTVEHPPTALGIGYHDYKGKTYLNSTFTYGEMSAIIAPKKSKKSFFKRALAACYIGGDAQNYFPSIVTTRNEDKYVLDFDTEQGPFYTSRSFRGVIEMVNQPYSNYLPFGMKGKTDDEMLQFIDITVSRFKDKIGIVFIDGIADLCFNTNDIEKSKKVMHKIIGWTDYGIHICNVIHKTFEKDKATGHLGTLIQNKSETTIFLNATDKEDFRSPVEVKQRDSRGIPFEKFYFDINEDGIPKECNEPKW